MSTHLSITKVFHFKEYMDRAGNRIDKNAYYLKALFEDEFSPLKAELSMIKPPAKVIININVEIITE